MNGGPSPYAPHWPAAGPGPSLGERLAVIAVGLLFGGALGLWLTGQLAALVFAGAWPAVSPADMGAVLVRLPANLADPAAAWPAEVRSTLPGPVAFYVTVAVLFAAFVALAGAAARCWRRVRERVSGPSAGRPDAARWASRRDVRALHVDRPVSGRLTLGRAHGRLVAAEPRQSAIVLAPTQSLKTTGLAIPALLEWNGPVLATSVKTDLLHDTLARRRALGDVLLYDPTASTGLPGVGWSPLGGCQTWHGAQQTAAWLCAAAQAGRSALADADFWYAAATKLLAPVLFAAARSGAAMADVVRWVDAQERDEVRDALVDAGVEEALIAAEATWRRDERQRSSIYTTTETVLAAYADPGVLASADLAELTPDRLLDGGSHTVYLCAPAHEQQRLRPLFATLVQQILAAVYERASMTGRPLDPPLLVVLDEAANIAPIRDLDTLASTAAGQGIQLLSVFQDLAQMRERWGERALTILNNHRAKIVGAGTSDPETLEYVSRVLGDEEIRQVSATAGQEGHASTTESTTFRSLAPPHLLRQAESGSGVLIYGNLPPARLALRPWFRDRALRELAAGSPAREAVEA